MESLTRKQICQIKQSYETPAYVYSLDKIHEQYDGVRKPLSPLCHIFYSMKANPLLAIAQYLAAQQSGCEVSSKNELLMALEAGFHPDDIIFVGPGKRDEELQLCVEKKIKAIICESFAEIERINRIAKQKSVIVPVMIRLNPDFQVDQAPIKMSGVASQFGIEKSTFKSAFHNIRSFNNINVCGIQIYNGSRILSESAIIANVKNILTYAGELSRACNIEWQYIDIGGGFGVPYFENECQLNVAVLIESLNHLFLAYQQLHPSTLFILELGRYLVAESGFLIASVIETKENHGKNFAIIDAGMHCHFSSTGLNSFVQRNFQFKHFPQSKVKKIKKRYQITGPLCTPGDVLLRNVECCEVTRGDFLVLFNVGAYGYTASPIYFLSHDAPAELVLHKNQIYLGRKRLGFHEMRVSQLTVSII